MKNGTFVSIVCILFLFTGCNNPKSKIKKDLQSRWTKFEIVEVKEDSANVISAIRRISGLGAYVSTINLEIITGILKIENEISDEVKYKTFLHIDSLYENMKQECIDFEGTKYKRPDQCYYVKYLIHKNESKIPKEEYYYINENNGEVSYRPYNWDDFLYENKYDELINNALKFHNEIFELKYKFKNR